MRVQSSIEKPPPGEAYASIPYRDKWFWLSDRDIPSKRGFGFLMVLFELAESGTTAAPPVLMIGKP
jgi:hypothetical protein